MLVDAVSAEGPRVQDTSDKRHMLWCHIAHTLQHTAALK